MPVSNETCTACLFEERLLLAEPGSSITEICGGVHVRNCQEQTLGRFEYELLRVRAIVTNAEYKTVA